MLSTRDQGLEWTTCGGAGAFVLLRGSRFGAAVMEGFGFGRVCVGLLDSSMHSMSPGNLMIPRRHCSLVCTTDVEVGGRS